MTFVLVSKYYHISIGVFMKRHKKKANFIDQLIELRKEFMRENINKVPTILYLNKEDTLKVVSDAPLLMPNLDSLNYENIQKLLPRMLEVDIKYNSKTTEFK
jgi:hypothetical protein